MSRVLFRAACAPLVTGVGSMGKNCSGSFCFPGHPYKFSLTKQINQARIFVELDQKMGRDVDFS